MSLLIVATIYQSKLYGSETTLANLNLEQLFSGEVFIEEAENQDRVPGVRVLFAVSAPRKTIWHVLTDYKNFPKIFKGTKSIKVISQNQSGAKVKIEYSKKVFGFFDVNYKYVLARSYIKQGELLTWRRESGDFNVIDGGWEIIDTRRPNTFLLIYESFLDGNWLFPAKLVRKRAMKEAVEMAKHVRNWMEDAPH